MQRLLRKDVDSGTVQRDRDEDWQEVASVVDSLAYTVKNLTNDAVYRFRVRAENVHGRSLPSQPSDLVELSTVPEVSSEDFHRPINIKSGGEFKQRFEILEELGKGRFGVVYKVQEKDEPRQILAAKVIKCIKARDRQKVQEEISIMKSLQHPKLLQIAASFESQREIVMVMEFITGGELFERVVADDFTLTELDCILFMKQVCEGVAYMHSKSIVHLDLKPENIMCHTRTSHQVKIIDFGLAQRLNTDAPVRVLFGTPEFIPPEILGFEPIGFQSDMWSVGVICYVLLSGLSPFMGDSDAETYANITRADFDFDDEAFDLVSQEAKDFISNLLVHRKENRWSAKQCLESKWLNTQRHDEHVSNNKICTDKLKKFIIRRKWQKTGNAIRALGRMANLSASRRNSAISVSGSLPSSPRPSISGISMFNPNISVQMGSLHEEDDDFSHELPAPCNEAQKRLYKTLKVRDKSQCSERSDSGYSECSNGSGSGNLPSQDVTDTAINATLLSVAVSHDMLKNKLEAIAKQVDAEVELLINELPLEFVEENNNEMEKQVAPLYNEPITESMPADERRCVSPTKEPLMRSDFTNTIKMRKKSLENSALREKVKPSKPLYDNVTSGKVSHLKNKFSGSSAASPPVAHALMKSKDCMDISLKSRKTDFNNKTNGSTNAQLQTNSMPSSPLYTRARSATSVRLSERVRETTQRLAQGHTISSAKRTEEFTTARRSTAPIRRRSPTTSTCINSSKQATPRLTPHK